jgi:AcrR family transcriptional regulator
MSTGPSGREHGRDRRKRITRQALRRSVLELGLEHGLAAVSVEAIAERADVSARTFFNYFETKDDAVLGLVDTGIAPEVARDFAAGGPTGRLLTDLQVLVGVLLESFAGQHERAVQAFRIMESEPRLLQRHLVWMDRHKAELRELFEARRAVRPFSADNEMLLMLVLLLLRTATTSWERSGLQGDLDSHLSDAVAQLIHVVASDLEPGA